MEKIVKIAQTMQQDHFNEKQQWNTLHKTQKTKNKMLNQQLTQTQAMIISLERENERLWRMFAPVHNKKRKHAEIVDLTEDDEPVVTIKTEVCVKEEVRVKEEVDIGQLIEHLQDMAIIPNNIQIKLEEIEEETDKEAESEPEPDQSEPDHSVPDLEQESEEPEQESEEPEQEESVTEEESVPKEEPVPVPEEEPEKKESVSEPEKEESVQEEEEQADKEEAEPEPEPEAEEEEVFLVTIDGKSYFTTNEKNGMLYGVTSDGDVGEEVGYYENGEAGFYEE
jgi:hypothetical protein